MFFHLAISFSTSASLPWPLIMRLPFTKAEPARRTTLFTNIFYKSCCDKTASIWRTKSWQLLQQPKR
jgi:hypothetical protein